MSSSNIVLKEVHVRMSGTASNRNYGNLSPEVKLIFIAEGLENWSEGLQQMVNTTHEAFEHAARRLVNDFEGIGSGNALLHELGIKPQTRINIVALEGASRVDLPDWLDADSSGNGVPDDDGGDYGPDPDEDEDGNWLTDDDDLDEDDDEQFGDDDLAPTQEIPVLKADDGS